MKRLTPEHQKYLEIRRKRAERHRAKKRRTQLHYSQIRRNKHALAAPPVCGLFRIKYRNKLLSFIKDLYKTCASRKHDVVYIDFANTIGMWSDGALLLKAEIQRVKRTFVGKTKIKCIPSNSRRVNEVLKQIGVFKDLGFTSSLIPTRDDVVHWCCAHGTDTDGEKFDTILGKYEGRLTDALMTGLYKGISEAMTNSSQHAYILPREDNSPTKKADPVEWWMFSQERNGKVMVSFCDLGIGIPRSLPIQKPIIWKSILKLNLIHHEGKVINHAVQMSKSRTGLAHRGKGLRQLVEAVENEPGGNMTIYSNKGLYRIDNNAGKTEETLNHYDNSIHGTLISWAVPLPSNKKETPWQAPLL